MRTAIATGIFAWATGAAIFIASDDKKTPPPVPTASEVKAIEPSLAADFPIQEARKERPPRFHERLAEHVKAAGNDELEAALDRLVSADFNESPLSQVLQFFGTDRNIRIYLDQSGLADAMVDKDQTITFQMEGVRLSLVLDLMLEPLNLDYAIRENVLFVSSKERIRHLKETTVLRIGDVIPQGEEGVEAATRLVELIISNIDNEQWEVSGGENSIQFSPDARSLVVTANSRTMRKVSKLLVELRFAKVTQGVPVNSQGTSKIAAR